MIKNFAKLYHNCLEQWTENQSVVAVVIIKSPCSSTEESEQMLVSYEVTSNYVHPVQYQDTLIEKLP